MLSALRRMINLSYGALDVAAVINDLCSYNRDGHASATLFGG
jgi:hypothetical protein